MLMFIHICICMNVYTCNDDNKRCHKFGLEGHEKSWKWKEMIWSDIDEVLMYEVLKNIF